jgi:glycosyltransferase involved in cell wall biosynthesis
VLNTKKIFVVDPHLKDFVGHYYEYDRSIYDAALERGYAYEALGHVEAIPEIRETLPVRRVFSTEIWDTDEKLLQIPRVGSKLNRFFSNYRFYRVLKKHLGRRDVGADSIVFCHMVGFLQLYAWAWWYGSLPKGKRPKLVLLLRYSSDWFDNPHTYAAFQLLEHHAKNGDVLLCSDSERLAREYSRFTKLPIDVFPIPHTYIPQTGVLPDGIQIPEDRLCVVSLGNARDEKGFVEILQAIRQLKASGDLERFTFILQSNRPDEVLKGAIADAKKQGLDNVIFIDHDMDTETYYAVLNRADIVLVPYWRQIYISRTSGVLGEAFAAGKPIIGTYDTWIGDQIEFYNNGIAAKNQDSTGLAQALVRMASDYSTYKALAKEAQQQWLAFHNPETLIDKLLSPTPRRQRPTKIGVIYPWGDILEQRTGAALRVGNMLQYLATRYDHIHVLSPPGWRGKVVDRNIVYEFYAPGSRKRRFQNLGRKLTYAYFWLITLGESSKESNKNLLWLHYEYSVFDPRFIGRIRWLMKWADVVFTEYSFYHQPIGRFKEQYQTKVVMTTYDVLANQLTASRLLRGKVLRHELQALESADVAVVVSPLDKAVFAKQTAKELHVIEHGINIERYRFEVPLAFAKDLLSNRHNLSLDEKNLCLFVGSDFPPNRDAARSIVEIARLIRQTPGNEAIHFVVAGNCMEPYSTSNFSALGKLDGESLLALYQVADLILIPLPYGTGASVKTVEAMAYGKAVLGTSVAFRGYTVMSGTDAILADNLAEYPGIIQELFKQPYKLEAIGRAAREFARQFDYRTRYQEYERLVEGRSELDSTYVPIRTWFNSIIYAWQGFPNTDIKLEALRQGMITNYLASEESMLATMLIDADYLFPSPQGTGVQLQKLRNEVIHNYLQARHSQKADLELEVYELLTDDMSPAKKMQQIRKVIYNRLRLTYRDVFAREGFDLSLLSSKSLPSVPSLLENTLQQITRERGQVGLLEEMAIILLNTAGESDASQLDAVESALYQHLTTYSQLQKFLDGETPENLFGMASREAEAHFRSEERF